MADDREAIHAWFGLTYANYLVLPRSVLQSMPDEWQKRFVEQLEELHRAFGDLDWPDYDVRVLAREPHFLGMPMVSCWDCGGSGRDGDGECETCAGEGELVDPEGSRYETAEEVGFRADPIPHYNRGRTRLAATLNEITGDDRG